MNEENKTAYIMTIGIVLFMPMIFLAMIQSYFSLVAMGLGFGFMLWAIAIELRK